MGNKMSVRNENDDYSIESEKQTKIVKCVKNDIKRSDKFKKHYHYCKCATCQKVIPIVEKD